MDISAEGLERRRNEERRAKPPWVARENLFGGRRAAPRRAADRSAHPMVDVYGGRLLAVAVLLTLLSAADACLTLHLVGRYGFFEANPLMAAFMEMGVRFFVAAKMTLTGAALFVFCLSKNFTLTRVAVAAALLIYIAVVYYELRFIASL